MAQTFSTPSSAWTLSASAPRALTIQAGLLLAAAWALPAVIHLLGLPVRQLLPMHWPVLLAGLVYGWRSGAAIGVLAPIVSYAISGMPRPVVLPSMTFELAAYGAIAGLCVEVLRRSRVEAALASVVGGRLVFLAVMVASGAITTPMGTYLQAAMVPGLPAAVAQVVVLPLVAAYWVKRDRR